MLEAIKNLGCSTIHVGCGEGDSLLRKDFGKFIEKCIELDFTTQFQTNGILATKDILEPILSMGPMHITLSFDSFTPSVYEKIRGIPYKLVDQALKTLISLREDYPRLSLSATCVITALNLSEIVEIVKKFNDLGIPLGLQPYHPKVCNGPNGLPELLIEKNRETELRDIIAQVAQLKTAGYQLGGSHFWFQWMPNFLLYGKLPEGYQCNAGYRALTIDSNLDVLSCWMRKPVGNILNEPVEDIWYSDHFMRERIKMQTLDCPGCWLASYVERWQI
jgi:MoaA/NifB/PqqE/SkfB family radical SAM enzyme